MLRPVTVLATIVLGGILLTAELSIAEPVKKQPTAEKMMPSDRVPKMRFCEKKAMDEKIETADRTQFIKACISKD